jgi:nucleoside-diphosphate-sugar epimerase
MRALVTGVTGKVGNAVARALAARGDEVRVLVRDPERAARWVPEGATTVRGDVTDPASLGPAAEGCELVFNAMGLPEQWLADEGMFEQVNARGTENVVRAAREAGVRRVVHTSTIDVFHAERGHRFDESEVATYPKGTAYERSKQHAEELALAARDGMELVLVNPAGVYGLGPAGSASFEEDFIKPLVRKRLPLLPPGGMGMSFTEGVAQGHLLAAEKGRDGERYILCDQHATFPELAELVVKAAGRGRVPPRLPIPAAKAVAWVGETIGRKPLLPRGQLHFFLWNAAPDSSKAQRELAWEPTPLADGIRATLETLDLH